MACVCSGARLKIERAEKHFIDLKEILANLPNLYTASVQVDSQGRGYTIEHDIPEFANIRNTLALTIGDCVHNLRSALDFAWYDTLVRLAPASPKKFIKFPVFQNGRDLERLLKDREVDTLSPALFALVIGKIKPYPAGNEVLWALHELDVADKHRLLLPLIQHAAISGITVKSQTEEEITGSTWGLDSPPPYRIDIPTTHQVEDKGELSLSVVFDKGTPFEGFEVSEVFSNQLLPLVKDIVKNMESI